MGDNSAQALEETIGRYNEAWNSHDLDAIMVMHAPDMVFENHTAGESAQGEAAREHIASYKAPRVVHFVGDFPRTRNGKVLRRALRPDLARA